LATISQGTVGGGPLDPEGTSYLEGGLYTWGRVEGDTSRPSFQAKRPPPRAGPPPPPGGRERAPAGTVHTIMMEFRSVMEGIPPGAPDAVREAALDHLKQFVGVRARHGGVSPDACVCIPCLLGGTRRRAVRALHCVWVGRTPPGNNGPGFSHASERPHPGSVQYNSPAPFLNEFRVYSQPPLVRSPPNHSPPFWYVSAGDGCRGCGRGITPPPPFLPFPPPEDTIARRRLDAPAKAAATADFPLAHLQGELGAEKVSSILPRPSPPKGGGGPPVRRYASWRDCRNITSTHWLRTMRCRQQASF